MDEQIQIIMPAGMFGANEFDSALDKFLRAVAVKHVAPDSDDWFPMGTPQRNAEKYGLKFENDVFLMRPDYQDVECECGFMQRYESVNEQWHSNNPHRPNCYQIELHQRLGERPEDADYDKQRAFEKKVMDELCEKHGKDRKWSAMVHCSCDWETRREAFNAIAGACDPRCPLMLPNFWYKPLDFRVTWYKYIGRDTETNKELSAAEFNEMWQACLGADEWASEIEQPST